MLQSQLNEELTEEYLRFAKENQKFDRKSAKKRYKRNSKPYCRIC